MLESMSWLRRMRRCMLLCGTLALAATSARADLMDLDLSGVPIQYRAAFVQAERFWESRLLGFSTVIPRHLLEQLHNIEFSVEIANVDGAGGVLAFCGPDEVFSYRSPYQDINVPQSASMTVDIDDIDFLLAAGLLDEVVLHEMAHGLGFGPLWTANGFNGLAFGNYNGTYALRQYRLDSRQPLAQFVPVEQGGGGGTAGAHWDSNDSFFFNQQTFVGELMIGFITDAPYVSDVTWASFADLGYKVKGINDKVAADIPLIPRNPKTVPNQNATGSEAGIKGNESGPSKTIGR